MNDFELWGRSPKDLEQQKNFTAFNIYDKFDVPSDSVFFWCRVSEDDENECWELGFSVDGEFYEPRNGLPIKHVKNFCIVDFQHENTQRDLLLLQKFRKLSDGDQIRILDIINAWVKTDSAIKKTQKWIIKHAVK